MKIIFMGTPEFAENILCKLCEKHNVAAVVTQADKPRGRGGKPTPTPVKIAAQKLDIPVLQPKSVKKVAFLDEIKQFAPDVLIVAAFGRLLPKNVLEVAKFGALNVHASLLPKYRGASPIQQAIINGEEKTGVSLMKMDEGLDTGDVMSQKSIFIEKEDNYGTLSAKLSNLGADLLLEGLDTLENTVFTPQTGEASYAPIIKKEDAQINWSISAQNIVNFIRGMNPNPVAFCVHETDGRLKVFNAETIDDTFDDANPGTVLCVLKNKGIAVKAAQGVVLLTEVQGANGKKMHASAYANGHDIKPGSKF